MASSVIVTFKGSISGGSTRNQDNGFNHPSSCAACQLAKQAQQDAGTSVEIKDQAKFKVLKELI
jgi:hypothetical protein